MSYHCEAVEKEAQPTLSIRTRTPVEGLPSVLGQGYGAIMQYLGELGEYPAGMPFVAYYNMDMQDLDIELGFPVSHPIPGRDTLQSSQIPAGHYATCLYTGPYEDMVPAYEALTAWIQEHGYEPAGVAYEFYLNGPDDTPPEGLQTQIMFLLKPPA
jgi:effector-binding domain-containing protein